MRIRTVLYKAIYTIITGLMITLMVSCDLMNVPLLTPTPTNIPEDVPAKESLNSEGLGLDNYLPPPNLASTDITFKVKIPENTPINQLIYLILRDEVTGLALNTESYPLQPISDPEDPEGRYFSITLQFPMGSVVKYHYERQTATVPVSEHLSNNTPVRYRLFHVEGPGEVNDVISKWTDTQFLPPSGRITGVVTDIDSGEPIPNMLVTAGGMQTITSSDGSYLIEGLPEGIHNLVAMAMDGSYLTFQQGARVAGESTTPADILTKKALLVNVAFVSQLPDETPPIVPVRLAGSLFQLGNTFGDLTGGMSSIATNMPVLTALPDKRYLLRIQLPTGSDIRYKYTLGDGFWNAEHSLDGKFLIRQIIVPEYDTVVLDYVDTWRSGNQGPVTFDIYTPINTPVNENVSIQFDPAYGWTTPIPMWSLGGNRWGYILFSPLNLPGDLHYRFCRNGQCNRTDDVRTVGEKDPGFPISIDNELQTLTDTIPSWSMLPEIQPETIIPTMTQETNSLLTTGIELEPAYHPSYRSLIPNTLGDLASLEPDMIIHTPTWTFTQQSPPVIEIVPGKNATWIEVNEMITLVKNQDLYPVLFPSALFPISVEEWWNEATRDYSWWLVWFEQYNKFIQHHADMANRNGISTLVLGGTWLDPSLPGGKLNDGTPSGVPADSEERWQASITNIRSRFAGNILWALPMEQISNLPPFIDSTDGIYLLWDATLSDTPDTPSTDLQLKAEEILDNQVFPLVQSLNKPIFLAISYPSAAGASTGCAYTISGDCIPIADINTMNPVIFDLSLNLQEQINTYFAVLTAANNRAWINGIISRGYYPPAALMDPGLSSHGKPLDELIRTWFVSVP